MSSSGLIGFLQILKGLEAEGRRTTSSSGARGRLDTKGICQDIAADGRYFWPWLPVRTTGCRLAADNKKGHGIAPFC